MTAPESQARLNWLLPCDRTGEYADFTTVDPAGNRTRELLDGSQT